MSEIDAGERKKVLVVDDDRVYRELLVFGLSAAGYEVYVAEHGARAVEVMAGVEPDVVLLDLLMPFMDGLRFLRWQEASGSQAPTIVLTCVDEEPRGVEALVAGAKEVLIKPVSLDLLLEKIALVSGGSSDGASGSSPRRPPHGR
jgi:two-component system response regulator MprA